VSEADENLRDSLREDVTEAREQVREQQDLGTRRDAVIDETAPLVWDGRLRGTRTAFIAIGELPGGVGDALEEAVESAGGELTRPAVYDPPETPRARRPADQRRLGRRIGRRGRAVDAVVVYRHPPEEAEGEEAARTLELREAFEEGLFDGLRDDVIGVEALDTDPSQVAWYEDRVVPSVDNIDTTAGRLALVVLVEEIALAEITGEHPEGSYGYKDTADRAIPDLSD
jgi:hypothetical protein